MVSVNLRQVTDAAKPILMACVSAWLRSVWGRGDGRRRIVVQEEAWHLLKSPAFAELQQANFKLARQYGVQNIAVLHHLGDLQAAGDAGSRTAELAKNLLADAATRVLYHLDEGELGATAELLGSTGPTAGSSPSCTEDRACGWWAAAPSSSTTASPRHPAPSGGSSTPTRPCSAAGSRLREGRRPAARHPRARHRHRRRVRARGGRRGHDRAAAVGHRHPRRPAGPRAATPRRPRGDGRRRRPAPPAPRRPGRRLARPRPHPDPGPAGFYATLLLLLAVAAALSLVGWRPTGGCRPACPTRDATGPSGPAATTCATWWSARAPT